MNTFRISDDEVVMSIYKDNNSVVVMLIEGDNRISIRLDYTSLVCISKFIVGAASTFQFIINEAIVCVDEPITED